MASEESSSTISTEEIKLSIGALFGGLLESYRRMDMPIQQYISFILIPSAGFFFLTIVAFFLLDFPLFILGPVPLLGLLAVGVAVFYPKVLLSQRERELNNQFHLMVTHMTVLATTKIDRMEVFRTLAEEESYGELADELGRIVELVDTWNQSLDDACRRRAKEVPSEPLSDFLDRLAYTLGAGQSLEDYLLSEQEQIIQNYTTVYNATLDNLEVMKDLYLSMILAMTFALVFSVVLPVLTGTDPTLTVSAVIVMFVFVQTGFFLAIRSISPFDPVWYHPEDKPSPVDERIRQSFYAGIGLMGLLFFVSLGGIVGISPVGLADIVPVFGSPLPMPLYATIPITPLLIPGLVLRSAENQVKGRDEEFPSFIRALGATEGAKQSTTSMVLESLRKKDFGPLTPNVDDLYKRLNMRIEPTDAWRHFTADCRSYLIQRFSEMYLIGREMGGSPKLLGELIAENMNEVLQLRQKRQQATITIIGLLYGITAASSFAFFIGLQVVNILASMSLDLQTSSDFDVASLINTQVYNIPLIEFLLVVVIMFSAMLSALMIRTVDGGHKMNTYMHFVVLAWVGALVAIVTKTLVNSFLAV
ncbi:MAG: archaellar assembly protein FlaJ [Salinirussus sp.]